MWAGRLFQTKGAWTETIINQSPYVSILHNKAFFSPELERWVREWVYTKMHEDRYGGRVLSKKRRKGGYPQNRIKQANKNTVPTQSPRGLAAQPIFIHWKTDLCSFHFRDKNKKPEDEKNVPGHLFYVSSVSRIIPSQSRSKMSNTNERLKHTIEEEQPNRM